MNDTYTYDELVEEYLRVWAYRNLQIMYNELGHPVSVIAMMMQLGQGGKYAGSRPPYATNDIADEMDVHIRHLEQQSPEQAEAIKVVHLNPKESTKELAAKKKVSKSTLMANYKKGKIWLSGVLYAKDLKSA